MIAACRPLNPQLRRFNRRLGAQLTESLASTLQNLAEGLRRKQMLPYRARVRARSMEEFDGWVRHDGEEFLYVLTGEIQLITEFYEPVDMRRGDSACWHTTRAMPNWHMPTGWASSLKVFPGGPARIRWFRPG